MNQRLRGVLGTALTWGAGWTVIGLAFGWLQSAALSAAGVDIPMESWRFVALATARWTVFGVVTGMLFALTLWYASRRLGSLDALSTRRAAAWGLAAGVVLPICSVALLTATGVTLPLVAMLPFVVIGGLFGAGTAAGTVALARRAPAGIVSGDSPALLPPTS